MQFECYTVLEPPTLFQKGQGLMFREALKVREGWLGQGKMEAGRVWKESGKEF